MCGRYTPTDPHHLQARFETSGSSETTIEPRFNVAASQAVPVVVDWPDGRTLKVVWSSDSY